MTSCSNRSSQRPGGFAAEVVAPLNRAGDAHGCTRHPDGSVTTPPGFREAYRQYRESGWGTLALPEAHGGQGLPHVLATAVEEFLDSACHAFNMYPGLTHGAVAALMDRGSDALKAAYLPKLVSGEWLGTMALTEAQAGTDLGLIRTRAEPRGDGSFAVTGEKIFCSGGEHDLTDNIVHLVLAKLPGAPEGLEGHLAVARAQGPARRQPQHAVVRGHRAQDGGPRQRDLRDELRRRDGLAGR
jgi:alkylation response protein AidB-like acyl-CoA dehydrogenase